MAYVTKSSPKRGPKFKALSSPGVKVARDGGQNVGTPTHCPATRGASNLRRY